MQFHILIASLGILNFLSFKKLKMSNSCLIYKRTAYSTSIVQALYIHIKMVFMPKYSPNFLPKNFPEFLKVIEDLKNSGFDKCKNPIIIQRVLENSFRFLEDSCHVDIHKACSVSYWKSYF